MRKRQQFLTILFAVTCLTAIVGGAAGAGGGAVLQPETHTDFGTGDESTPMTVENFSIGGSGDDATLTGPVGGEQRGADLVSDDGSISWSEAAPSTSQTAINVTGVTNSQWNNKTATASAGDSISIEAGGTMDPTGPSSNNSPVVSVTAPGGQASTPWESEDEDQFIWGFQDGVPINSEIRIPNAPPTISKASVDVANFAGSAGDTATVDIYIAEDGVDQTYTDGEKVATDVSVPLDSPGWVDIPFDSTYSAESDNVTLQIVTTNAPSDSHATGSLDGSATQASYSSQSSDGTGDPGYFSRDSWVRAQVSDGTVPDDLSLSTESTTVDFGTLSPAETASQEISISRSDNSITVDASNDATNIDVELDMKVVSKTRDPVVELNGDPDQQVTIDGTLGGGETVIKEIDSSWLETNNTATVSLDDSSLPEGSPPMEARVSAEVPAQSARYVSAPYDTLSASGGVSVNWSGSGTLDVTIQGYDGSSWVDARELSTSQTGQTDLDYEPIDYQRTRVEIVAEGYVQIEEESLLFETYEPKIDESSASPSSENGVTGPPVELSVDVSDRDFGFLQSDTVEVEFFDASDDTSFGTTTLTSAGTATETFDDPVGGLNRWYVVATDSHGNEVTSPVFEFRTPSVLELRNESSPGQFVTEESNIEVRFFGQESAEVTTRTATNGTIDMTGLPVDEPLIASTDVNGYFQRSIAIDSILEQQRMFLLPESADASQVDWVLDDNTGRFDPTETVLYIERPIEINGQTEYRTIYGETFGGTGRTASTLATDDRYRLRVENQDGNVRLLGSYVAAGAAQETLTVGSVDFPGLDDTGTAFSATLNDDDGVIDYRFADDAGETSELTVEVYQNGDLVQNATLNGPIQTVREQIPLSSLNHSEGDSYRIEYQAQRNGIVVDGTRIVGDVPEIAEEWNIDPGLLNILGFVTVIASFGAVVILSPRHAGIVASSVLFGLSLIGVVTVSNILVGFAFLVSGVFAAAGGNP